jgi:hypothetical protein
METEVALTGPLAASTETVKPAIQIIPANANNAFPARPNIENLFIADDCAIAATSMELLDESQHTIFKGRDPSPFDIKNTKYFFLI